MSKKYSNIPIIILAGGKGERFISRVNLPKQLAKVSKHPIIIEIILYYYKKGFNQFILPLGFKSNFFLNFFKNKKNIKKYNFNILNKKNKTLNNSKINISLFNAGSKTNKLFRIRKSIDYIINDTSIIGVCYGDIFANILFKKELLNFKNKKIQGVLTGYKENSPYGHLDIKNRLVKKFNEKPKLEKPINIGFYFFKKKLFYKINHKSNEDLEASFLPKLTKKNRLVCHIHNGYHFTVNSQKDLIEVKKNYKKNKNFFSNF